jgi:hypothetical protein
MIGVMIEDDLILYDIYTGRVLRHLNNLETLRQSGDCSELDISKIVSEKPVPVVPSYNPRVDKDRAYSSIISCLEGDSKYTGYDMMEVMVPDWRTYNLTPISYKYINVDVHDNYMMEMKLLSKAVVHLMSHDHIFRDRVFHGINSRHMQDSYIDENKIVDDILEAASISDHNTISNLVLDLNISREISNVKYATYNPVCNTDDTSIIDNTRALGQCLSSVVDKLDSDDMTVIDIEAMINSYNMISSRLGLATINFEVSKYQSKQALIKIGNDEQSVSVPLADNNVITIPIRGACLELLDIDIIKYVLVFIDNSNGRRDDYDILRLSLLQELSWRRRKNREVSR